MRRDSRANSECFFLFDLSWSPQSCLALLPEKETSDQTNKQMCITSIATRGKLLTDKMKALSIFKKNELITK